MQMCRREQMKQLVFSRTLRSLVTYLKLNTQEVSRLKVKFAFKYEQYFISFFHASMNPKQRYTIKVGVHLANIHVI